MSHHRHPVSSESRPKSGTPRTTTTLARTWHDFKIDIFASSFDFKGTGFHPLFWIPSSQALIFVNNFQARSAGDALKAFIIHQGIIILLSFAQSARLY